jgi:hypothetical protein
MKKWLTTHYYDFEDSELLRELQEFLHSELVGKLHASVRDQLLSILEEKVAHEIVFFFFFLIFSFTSYYTLKRVAICIETDGISHFAEEGLFVLVAAGEAQNAAGNLSPRQFIPPASCICTAE